MSEADNFSDKLESLLKDVAETVNGKEGGLYTLQEKGSGAQYYNKDNEGALRNVYRKTYDLTTFNGGSIGGSETIQFPHNIENLCESAGITANCTTVDGLFFTASYPDICLDRTSIVFTNPYTEALVQCDVIANYLKT
jgi:hypothetical protein